MSFSVSSCLEKMSNRDKDFRFMATSDLATELTKESFKMNSDEEKKICEAVVKLLEDSSGDVQGLAVKCLGPLIERIKEPQLLLIVNKLTDHLLQNEKSELRDIAGIGLKTVITQTSTDSPVAPLVVETVTPKLIKGIEQDVPEIVFESLGVLSDLLRRLATLMNKDHERIQKAILPHLTSMRVASRKKAISCLGFLSISTPDALFTELVNYIVTNIKKSKKTSHISTLISVVGAISRSVGHRLGKFLGELSIVKLLIKFMHDERFEEEEELKENCFQTFESLVLRCPTEIKPFLDEIVKECLEFVKYDPNQIDMEEEEEEEEQGSDEEDFSGEEEDYDDEDDMSWKVRRSSAKCLSAIITTRPDLIADLYKEVVPAIIARFKEREDNVKLDIFSTFGDVLKQTVLVSKSYTHEEDSPLALLKQNVPSVIANLNKELNAKTVKVKTRIGIFQLLKELVNVRDGILAEHVGTLIGGIESALAGKNTNATLKMEALTFLRLLISTHPPKIFTDHVDALSKPVLEAVGDNYYKITAEALRVTSALIKVLRPFGQESSVDYKPYAGKIYGSIFDKYDAQDIDQEVKEAAITCMGLLIARLGDELSAEQLQKALAILVDRLKNEITRITSVKAIIEISTSPLDIDLKAVLSDVVSELAAFLRQTNRQLKQVSLQALAVVVKNYGKKGDLSSKLYTMVLDEVANLVSDADLHLSHLAIRLVEAIVAADAKSTLPTVQSKIYPQVLALVRSPLLQGLALESLLSLYATLVKAEAKKFGFAELLDSLLAASTQEATKQSLANIAKCIAALVVSVDVDNRKATVDKFIADIRKGKKENSKVLALLSLGEIGRQVDLNGHKGLRKSILSAFDGSEEEKTAASFCLGNIAVGNVKKFLPYILKEIKAQPNKQYLLMHSLEEVISRSTGEERQKALLPYLSDVLELLFVNTESEEEGNRTVVAKCLGKFTLISPDELVPALEKHLGSESALARATIVTAIKFTVVDYPHPADDKLQPIMAQFLALLKDSDVNVRRAALLTLNYAAHNKPKLIREVLPEHLDALYEETKFKKELVKVVDLGPFKHKVDEGLENRKAAFECMYTLLDTCLTKLDLHVFINQLVEGLNDACFDIKLLCHLMLVRLAGCAPVALVTNLDNLVEPLRKTVTTKARDTAVKQQVDQNDELIRSALRAVAAISTIPDVDQSVKFDEFVKGTIKGSPLNEKFEAILKETSSSSGSAAKSSEF
ncbi:Cullin-associated NEDD8-dissociated protein 1 [Balamuthia mandrillaris]